MERPMRLLVLDSLRGLFALAIVLLHAPFQGSLHYNPFIRNSAVFVDFFFVLSGFVIALAYGARVRDGRTLGGFLVRRAGRLWPLHAFVLLALLAILAVKLAADRLGLFSAALPYTVAEIQPFALESLLLVQSFRNETVFWLNFPSWSISVELWAYVTFGILCLAPRLLPFAAVAVTLLAAAVMRGTIDPGFGHFFGNGLWRGLAYFFLGYLAYQLWRRLEGWRLPAPTLLEAGLVALVVWQVAFGSVAVREGLLPLTFALTILVFAWEAGAVSRLLKAPPFLALGTLSYSIYMIHILVFTLFGLGLRMVERVMDRDLSSPDRLNPAASELVDLGAPLVNDLVMVALAGVVVACAFVTYRLIEQPGQRMARQVARGLEARSSPVGE
jgi:peptidoglycan/LPS O-acetylase OafA/YrhL